MKKLIIFVVLIFIISFSACNFKKVEFKETDNSVTSNSANEKSDTIIFGDFEAKILDCFPSKDGEGNDAVTLKIKFTNNSSEAKYFNQIFYEQVFQDGIEQVKDNFVCGDGEDWATYEKEIKNGASIIIYTQEPIEDVNKPVEVTISAFDSDKVASKIFDLKKVAETATTEKSSLAADEKNNTQTLTTTDKETTDKETTARTTGITERFITKQTTIIRPTIKQITTTCPTTTTYPTTTTCPTTPIIYDVTTK